MPKQILLADDSITIQKVIALTFAGEDYKITPVDNGVDAIARAKEIRPDIILADVVMPQKNGYEVSAEIKNSPELKNIPILLLAGTFEPFDEDEAKRVGADGYIIKPFESQILIQKVKDLIAGRGVVSAQPAVTPPAPVPPKAAPVVQPPVSPKAPPIPVVAPTPPAPAPVAPPRVAAQPPKAPVPPAPPLPPKIQAPSVARPTVQPVAPPPVAQKPLEEEDIWGTMMEEVEEKAAKAKPAPVQRPVSAAPSPDVWDMGELEEAKPARGEEELWESFAFEEAKEEEAPVIEEAAEEEFFFGAEEVGEAEIEEIPEIIEEEQVEFVEEPAEIVAEETMEAGPEEFAFKAEISEAAHAAPTAQVELQPEISESYEQTFEPEAISIEIPLAPPSEPAPLEPSMTLPEDQLRAVLSKVSKEVIEKIVWEVVPDMAEMLIKEEIKRLQKK